METAHQSVLLEEAVSYLSPVDGGIYIDGNLGLGGHAERILEQCGPTGNVIGFEWDIAALDLARKRLKPYGRRINFQHRNFAEVEEALAELNIDKVDGVMLDLGLSSLQLDAGARGFSFKGNEPLDMRMDVRVQGTAADILNEASRDELADIFYHYGEERQARRIASFVVEERRVKKFETTDQLVAIIEKAVPKRFRPKKIHVATKVFQALRIAVNRELENLSAILNVAENILKPGARLCVISFHSLEDRIVKKTFRESLRLMELFKKPVTPDQEEVRNNPRARSAKLRVAAMRG